MKKFSFIKGGAALLFILLVCTVTGFSQAPESFNYQAVVRDNAGTIIANQNVSFRIGIRETSPAGTVVYQETHAATTNDFGLVNFAIGDGTTLSGTFANINWGSDAHFVEIELDETGGSSYTSLGVQQLISVPYALHANSVTNDLVDDADADSTNELNTTAALNGTDLEITDAGGTLTVDLSTLAAADADSDTTNELNTNAALNGTDLEITDAGGTLTVPLASLIDDADADSTNELNTTAALNGTDLEITDAGGTLTVPLASLIDDADADTTNELQTLSLTGSDLTISDGNTVSLSTIANTDNQDLSLTGNTLSLTNDATPVDLSGYLDNTDNQDLSSSASGTNRTINITGGTGTTFSVADLDNDPANEIQTISYSGSTLTLSNGGGTATIPNGDITGVTAGAGLTGGGTSGTPTLTAAANNGLNVDATADRIQLGGALVEATTVSAGTFNLDVNLNSTGDFRVMDGSTQRVRFEDGGRVEMLGTADASGTAGTGVLEIGNALRFDGNEMITNTNAILYINNDNQGDVSMDGSTFRLDASTDRIGIGDVTPAAKLEVGHTAGQSLMLTRQDATIVSGEQLGGIGFDGSDGNTPTDIRESSAAILAFASETHGTGDKGGRLTFWTSPINQDDNTDGFERLRIDQDGNHYVGGDMYWRDASVTGTNLMRIVDDGDDGQLIIYENGGTSILLDGNGTSVFNQAGANHDFRIESDTETNMFFLDASTNRIGIANTAPVRNFHVEHDQFTGTGGAGGLAIEQTSNGATWHFYTSQSTSDLRLYFGNTARGAFNDATGAYTAVSDKRLKKNIINIGPTMDRIMQLRPTEYNMIDQKGNDMHPGLIAQEVKEVFPLVVKVQGDDENGSGIPNLNMIAYSELIPYMIKGMQEQQEEVQELKKENAEMRNELDELRRMIEAMQD